MSPRETYEQGRAVHAREVSALAARANRVATARLALAAAALGLLGVIVWMHPGAWASEALGAVAVAFVVLVWVHARIHLASERASAALRFHGCGLARLAHDWDKLPATSSRFRSTEHPFAADLDIFGRASLMQLVDVTETRFGEERLARLLSLESPGNWPDDMMERQEAARELAPRSALREALATVGGVLGGEKPDPAPFLTWAEATTEPPRAALAAVAWAMPLITLAAVSFGPAMHLPGAIVTAIVVAQLALGIAVGVRLTPMFEMVSARESAVTRWRAMIVLLEGEKFQAPLLVRLREGLAAANRPPERQRSATKGLANLERIVSFVDARRNEIFRLFIGPLLMWDAHCAMALVGWRARDGKRVRGWLDALGEVEALASLAAFAFEHPDFAWPVAAARPMFEARALGHPIIPDEQRVGNDVDLQSAGCALVVTGSNMSGKSTLLRAIGVNAVLAYAGGPVCAGAMSIGPARLVTSLRIEDSLEEGVSHFYAELRRLKRVIELARDPDPAPVLFLLDEILHGTNSRERVIGASAVVQELIQRGALGALSTHDLGITALEREVGRGIQNVHFEEQVTGDKMTFDYVLRPGIVQSSNALRLMRAVGILTTPP